MCAPTMSSASTYHLSSATHWPKPLKMQGFMSRDWCCVDAAEDKRLAMARADSRASTGVTALSE